MIEKRHIGETAVYAAVLMAGIWLFVRLDAYEAFHRWSRAREGWELDELALILPAVLVCLVLFSFNRTRELRKRARLLEESRRELAKAHESLRSLNQSREAFLTTACHELKSPLIGIVNAFELLRMTEDQGEREELIQLAGVAARKLGILVDGVLEFSRQESMAPAPTVFSPAELLASVRDMSLLQVRSRGLALTTETADGTPPLVRGGESVLRLVALNLVGNAVRYTDRGGIRVELGSRDNPAEALVLTVSDTGRGIRAEDLATIFDPFSTTAGGPGLGIGLSIVKRLMERCRGTIEVDSAPGRGARFTVQLPVEVVDAP
ncbi:integral membrane sensor signal transduction histidine kinase [Pseudodesulfovibrio mercurii]|uniref:histidine kinase n=1 Tax=Pseudodesulfovibrio mercurii TaxID=641491 RepID=F0JBK4_9BACT|nr:HAMP domain-containing sensor histidine kinase [Pseudodesulfovibrio mercurii]EGB15507.1 integral membrane sensor signal transduction histidine kinase [Pseudodesulfovibrio mercurii]